VIEDSHRRWLGSMADAYDAGLNPVFGPFAIEVAHRVADAAPEDVLELAAGTGILTAELIAALPRPRIVATDLNDAMIATGRRRAPGATWRTADAMALPFTDAAFDVVVSQFGTMFFPDRVASCRHARRVLRTGGRLVVATWGTLSEHDIQDVGDSSLASLFPADPPVFMHTVPHRCDDPDVLAAEVADAGLTVVVAERVVRRSAPAAAATIAAGVCFGTPLRAEIEARGDLDDAVAHVTAALHEHLGADDISGSMTAVIVEAVRRLDRVRAGARR
jgi:SAM-dependent methyltransferase